MIKINQNSGFLFLLVSLLFLTACDQSGTVNAPESVARISFQTNEHDRAFGNYVVHVNALTTAQLPAEVAQGYQISRSQNRAMLNVSVRKKSADGEMPVTAKIDVIAKNLSNQLKDISIREIQETDPLAIYYIGEVTVSNEETLVFDIDLKPEGNGESILISYRQQFFTK